MLVHIIWQPLRKVFWQFQRWRNRDFAVLAFLVADLLVGALLVQHFENAEIKAVSEQLKLWDCLWLAVTTATTVGYGDISAHSAGGRLASILFFYLGGIGVAAYLLGRMVELGLDFRINKRKGLLPLNLSDHILICNYPSARTVEQIIQELRADPRSKDRPIVIVTDSIEELTLGLRDVFFVRGNPMEEDPLIKADVADAWMAIIRAQNIDEPHADALVSATVVLIKGINPDCTCVVECADKSHQKLLKQCGADRIVFAGNLTSNLIVQEAIDYGVSALIESFSSNRDGAQFYSECNRAGERTVSQFEQVLQFLDPRAHTMAICRNTSTGEDCIALPAPEEKVNDGDYLVYVARSRLDWEKVQGRLKESQA